MDPNAALLLLLILLIAVIILIVVIVRRDYEDTADRPGVVPGGVPAAEKKTPETDRRDRDDEAVVLYTYDQKSGGKCPHCDCELAGPCGRCPVCGGAI